MDTVLHALTRDAAKLRLGRRDNLDLEDLIRHEHWQTYLSSRKGRRLISFLRYVISWAVMFVLVAWPMPARASELSSGVSLGGVQAGTVPRLAVSPNVGIIWHMNGGAVLALHDLFSVLPPIGKSGFGVYNHTSAALGYAWENGQFDAGPSFSIYSMIACGATLCGRVTGVAPGGYVQASLYFDGPLGVSVSAHVDWVGGSSLVLPGGVALMVVVGPVFRWNLKRASSK